MLSWKRSPNGFKSLAIILGEGVINVRVARCFLCALSLAFVFVIPPRVSEAAVVYDSSLDSYYMVVNKSVNWYDAREEAKTLQHAGRAGHLVTITSAAENLFLTSSFGNSSLHLHWIGGFQKTGAIEPAGGWSWVTNEPFIYSNWFRGNEPNGNDSENEIVFDHLINGDGKSWNDLNGSSTTLGYIVEFSGRFTDVGIPPKEQDDGSNPNPDPSTVPEPGSGAIGGLLVALAVAKYRLKRAK